jgi:two-component system LytT family sensor kinase
MRPRRSLFWTLQFGGWTAFFLAMFVAGISHWPAGFTLVHKLSLTVFGFVMSLVLRAIYLPASRRLTLPALIALAVPLSFFAAAPWMAAHYLVIDAYRFGWTRAAAGFPNVTNTIYYSFVLIAWSVLYFGIQSWLDQQDDRERLLKAEALAQDARLRALRLQLNPHFLFNALNGISTLIAEERNDEANRMVQQLSEFLRTTLEQPDRNEIPLFEEIAFARRYLEIEKVRFGERLQISIEVDSSAEQALVPPMILQPLVENAVRHAVLPRENGGSIVIRAAQKNGALELSVKDDGPGLAAASVRTGIGLTNTRERLRELYGESSGLRLDEEDGGTLVSIQLPYREQPA